MQAEIEGKLDRIEKRIKKSKDNILLGGLIGTSSLFLLSYLWNKKTAPLVLLVNEDELEQKKEDLKALSDREPLIFSNDLNLSIKSINTLLLDIRTWLIILKMTSSGIKECARR